MTSGVRPVAASTVAASTVAASPVAASPVNPGTRALNASWPWLVVLGALLLWHASLSGIDLKRINELGLVSALPWNFYLAPLLLSVSYWTLTTRREARRSVMLAHLIAMLIVLQVTLPLLYGVARFSWAYKHIGVVDYILSHGSVDASIDAYHNWPGFFSLIASLVRLGGLGGELELARWTPLAYNLLYLGPLLMIFRALTRDARVAWSALWLFVVGNWIGQDYFSPQGFAYFLYLFVIAGSLTWLKSGNAPGLADEPSAPLSGTPLPYALLLLACLAIAASHQLTPFMLLASLTALIAADLYGSRKSGRSWSARWPKPLTGLFALTLTLTAVWDLGMAQTFLKAYSHWYSTFGHLGQNFEVNVVKPAESSPGHTRVVLITRAMTFLLWGSAALGLIRAHYARTLDIRALLLAGAPFPLLALGSYGGEMTLRIYLFSLPFMAYLASTAFVPASERRRWWDVSRRRVGWPAVHWPHFRRSSPRVTDDTPFVPVDTREQRLWENTGSLATPLLMLTGLWFSAYGNELTNRVTPQDVQAARILYSRALPGSAIIPVSINSFPYRLAGNYPEFEHLLLADDQQDRDVTFDAQRYQALKEQLRETGVQEGYVVLSEAQRAYSEHHHVFSPGAYQALLHLVKSDPHATLTYRSGQTMIYRILPAPAVVPR